MQAKAARRSLGVGGPQRSVRATAGRPAPEPWRRRAAYIAERATAGRPVDGTFSLTHRGLIVQKPPSQHRQHKISNRFAVSDSCSMVRVAASQRFVYRLQSLIDPRQYYVGLTSNPAARVAAHNAGESPHTSQFKPWRVLVTIEFADEGRALAFERYLKSGSGREFARRHFR